MTELVLYGALNSGHSYKVRLALMLSGIGHRYERINLDLPREQRPEPFRSLSKFGEVPVLTDDNEVLAQSNACLLHIASKYGVLGWQNAAERNAITQWLFWEANRIGRSYPNLRFCRLFDRAVEPGLERWFEQTTIADLSRMDEELSSRSFLLDRPTIADVSLAAYLLYGDDIGLKIARWQFVSRWLDRVRALSGWQHPLEAMA